MDSKPPGSDRPSLPLKHSIYDDDGPENIRSVIGWTVGCLVGGFLITNALIPNNDVNIAVDVILGVMGIMALFYYAGTALRAIWTGSRDNTDYLIVGIALSWTSHDSLAWLRVVSRLSGFDPAWLNSELFAPFKILAIVAAVMHVIPRGAANGVVPRASRFVVVGFFSVAVALAIAVLVLRPDPKPMIERMPGWSRDLFQTGEAPAGPPPV